MSVPPLSAPDTTRTPAPEWAFDSAAAAAPWPEETHGIKLGVLVNNIRSELHFVRGRPERARVKKAGRVVPQSRAREAIRDGVGQPVECRNVYRAAVLGGERCHGGSGAVQQGGSAQLVPGRHGGEREAGAGDRDLAEY